MDLMDLLGEIAYILMGLWFLMMGYYDNPAFYLVVVILIVVYILATLLQKKIREGVKNRWQ